jgi:hypothetical protein
MLTILRSVPALLIAIFGMNAASAAEPLPAPSGEVILTITGDIGVTNAADRVEFDREMLEGLGLVQVETSTSWTEGVQSFEGVPASVVLDAVEANGTTVTAVALNDYKVQIPISDFRDYPVILALNMNGQALRIRDKGPIWIVYPRDDYPELAVDAMDQRWIWQVKELHVD